MLFLGDNQIAKFPLGVCHLRQLEVLQFGKFSGGNKIEHVPPEIENLTNLTELTLTKNFIKFLPNQLCSLHQMRSLHISDNIIRNLPKNFGNLTNLRTLVCGSSLGGNLLAELPANFEKLTNLTSLGLTLNGFENIPCDIFKISKLQELYLAYNQIGEVPEEISTLTELRILSLTGNPLDRLPVLALRVITQLKTLNLDSELKKKYSVLTSEIRERGKSEREKQLRETEEIIHARQREAKQPLKPAVAKIQAGKSLNNKSKVQPAVKNDKKKDVRKQPEDKGKAKEAVRQSVSQAEKEKKVVNKPDAYKGKGKEKEVIKEMPVAQSNTTNNKPKPLSTNLQQSGQAHYLPVTSVSEAEKQKHFYTEAMKYKEFSNKALSNEQGEVLKGKQSNAGIEPEAVSQVKSEKKTPDSFICPITQELMNDPVIAEDGHTYERSAISAWLEKSTDSPITREPISKHLLIPNRALKGAIEEWQKM